MMEASTGLRWALLGASDIAATRMIPAMRHRGDVVKVVLSSNGQHAQNYANTNKIPHGTTNLAEALGSDIDAVYISSTNERHLELALAAIEAKKHVLCEKPLALTAADCDTLVAAAEAAGVVLAVNHHLPGSPLHSAARELVQDGRIGDLLSARVFHSVMLPERLRGWRLDSAAAGGGVIMDITCHDASVLNPLMGTMPTRVTAIASRQGPWGEGSEPDAVMTTIEYEPIPGSTATRLAQTHDAFTVPFDTTRLEIQGSTGSIVVRDAMTQDSSGTVELITETGSEHIDVDASVDLYAVVINAFADAIAGHGEPIVDGAGGALNVRVALAAQASAETGQTIRVADVG